jgi:pimeloyl-ACP methyl ester carboxylesterase
MGPETKYARSGDIYIAYQVTGERPIDVVWAPGTVSHLDLDWDSPARARLIERFSSFCRLIRFDKRGTGLSDRPTDAATLEERTDDIRAVMDACGSERAVIFGVSEGASMACVFAATFPRRTRALIVWGGQARWVRTDDYPWGLTPSESERLIGLVREQWPSVEYLQGPGAGLGRDVDTAVLDWFLRYARASASPSAIVALEQMNAQIDIRDILPTIRVPALVMNRTGDPVADIEAARDLAAHIPGARFLEFPGATHSISAVEPERVLAAIEEFVTGTRAPVAVDRLLATILFIDIVGSTARAAALGDAGWRDLLERFNTLTRHEITAFAGVEVDRAGDGLLAWFDGPGRAIRCAVAIREAVRRFSIDIRAGVHSGECEIVANKLGGIAVHIGARVMERAAPGEILVSSTVKDLVVGSAIAFEDRGYQPMKGIPGEWRVFAVR